MAASVFIEFLSKRIYSLSRKSCFRLLVCLFACLFVSAGRSNQRKPPLPTGSPRPVNKSTTHSLRMRVGEHHRGEGEKIARARRLGHLPEDSVLHKSQKIACTKS